MMVVSDDGGQCVCGSVCVGWVCGLDVDHRWVLHQTEIAKENHFLLQPQTSDGFCLAIFPGMSV
jgi:hypothetical protein